MYPNSRMNFGTFFDLGDSDAHGDFFDMGQSEDIDQSTNFDWLPSKAAHLESHLGPEIPHGRRLVGPGYTALTMMDYQVQLNDDSNMTNAGLCYEEQATLADWNNSDTTRVQELDLPVTCSSSVLTDDQTNPTAGHHLVHTEPGLQTREPSVAANHHLEGSEASSVKRASSEDWAKHRGLITSLYEKMTLRKVIRHMEPKEGFSAT